MAMRRADGDGVLAGSPLLLGHGGGGDHSLRDLLGRVLGGDVHAATPHLHTACHISLR